jgi:hypothetical protein
MRNRNGSERLLRDREVSLSFNLQGAGLGRGKRI